MRGSNSKYQSVPQCAALNVFVIENLMLYKMKILAIEENIEVYIYDSSIFKRELVHSFDKLINFEKL